MTEDTTRVSAHSPVCRPVPSFDGAREAECSMSAVSLASPQSDHRGLDAANTRSTALPIAATRPSRARLRALTDRFASASARTPVIAALTAIGFVLCTAPASAQSACPNAEFRVGPAGNLPDCRGYELVSHPIPSNNAPTTNGIQYLSRFNSQLVSADGNSLVYDQGPAVPGLPGNGVHDRYLATRTAQGWTTSLAGPTGAESQFPGLGGISSDLAYSVVSANALRAFPDYGSLASPYPPQVTTITYLRLPDGTYELVGKGSLGEDPQTIVRHVTPGAKHVLFNTRLANFDSPVQLEPNAPPGGTVDNSTGVIYDREIGGETKVVSLLPGDVTPTVNEDAIYMGASTDGELVAFKLQLAAGISGDAPGPLYVRVNNQETYEVTPSDNTFAGIFGGHVFYSDAPTGNGNAQAPADLYSFDTSDQSTTQIADTGDARFVNVSDDGSRVYFASPSQIDGQGTAGQQNLYLWERVDDSVTYVATVSEGDVTGGGAGFPKALGAWNVGVGPINDSAGFTGRALATSRATPDGSVLVFQSDAQLTGFVNGGHDQIYRYDAATDELTCVSCAGAEPATGPAQFQQTDGFGAPVAAPYPVTNLSTDGGVVTFEAESALVPADTNGKRDVYRWTASDGVALISTGKDLQASHIWAVTPDASDIMFLTAPDLVPLDQTGGIRAIYTARVNGGLESQFVADEAGGCTGEACQDDPTVPPAADTPGSTSGFSGNVSEGRSATRCGTLANRAAKVRKQGRRLKRQGRKASRAGSARKAKRLRKQARRKTTQARKLSRRARACRAGTQ